MAGGIFQPGFQLLGLLVQVNGLEQLLDGFCTHANAELVSVSLPGVLVFLFGQYLLVVQTGLTGIQHDIGREIKHFFQHPGREIQDQSHSAGNSLEVPDMRYRRCQFNMAHALSADTGLCNLHAAAVADYTLISDFLVFAAMAFPVFVGPENFLTEQTVPLGLQCSVVDGFRLHDLSMGPFADLIR